MLAGVTAFGADTADVRSDAVNAAAGDAFRARVRQENFGPALAFTFGPLPARQREPLVSALASVAQQRPDPARVLRVPSLPVTKSAAKPGQLRVLLMTGANNHNWQETTAALKSLLAESPKFFVTVTEKPWEMKPADLEGRDLIFNNWNTYGKDKREWSAEMKAAFMAWVKRGGGFFVLHAGGKALILRGSEWAATGEVK